jgi:Mce-associated membrane protein
MRAPALNRRRIAVGVTALMLAASLATIIAGQAWLHSQRQTESLHTDAIDAAQATVTSVLSYDYRRLAAAVEATTPLLTGDAKAQYIEVQEPLQRSAPRMKSVVTAEVNAATVLEVDEDSARVLLFVNQTSTSKNVREPQLDQSRILVTMENIDGEWLVATLAAI